MPVTGLGTQTSVLTSGSGNCQTKPALWRFVLSSRESVTGPVDIGAEGRGTFVPSLVLQQRLRETGLLGYKDKENKRSLQLQEGGKGIP